MVAFWMFPSELATYLRGLGEKARKLFDSRLAKLFAENGIGALAPDVGSATMPYLSGYNTIAELRSDSWDAIARRTGLADGEARRVRTAAGRIETLAKRNFQVSLNPRERSDDANALMVAVLKYRAAARQAAICGRLLAHYKSIQRACSDVDLGTRTLRWAFATPEQQETVTNAFEYLESMLGGEYGTGISRAEGALRLVSGLDTDLAWRDYTADPEAYLAVLDEVANGRFTGGDREPRIPPYPLERHLVEQAIDWHGRITSELESALLAADEGTLAESVRHRANDVVEAILARRLQSMPVEELNRGGKGYRVGALKAAGYESVASIADASARQIGRVKGVSLDSARMIKRECELLGERARGDVRIRLDTDDRTPEAVSLVIALHALVESRGPVSRCKGHLAKARGRVAMAAKTLVKGGYDEISWLVSEHVRRSVPGTYATLVAAQETYAEEWDEDLARLRETLEADGNRAWAAFTASPIEYINALEDVVPELMGASGNYGLPDELAKLIEEQEFFPDGLLCRLRRYQVWGVKFALHQKRVLLGDEMGLGKTVQAIATMVSLRNTGETHFVVVCPASVIVNWCREIRAKSRLRVYKVHGREAQESLRYWNRAGGVAVTTYGLAPRIDVPENVDLGMLVVDEAHYVKNPRAARTKVVRRLGMRTERALFMTGTALENRVDEMLALIEMLQPQVTKEAREWATLSQARSFRDIVVPVYFRRKREDVLTEMPDLVQSTEWCELGSVGPKERSAYALQVLDKNFMGMRRVSWDVDARASSKATRLRELIDEAAEDGRKVLVFSYFLETIQRVCGMLGNRTLAPIHGSVTPARRQAILDDFERADAGCVLVAQIQAGGTGLNIQSASVVVICEPQIKPSLESQAISRAYRMGQTRKVLVYRLLCEDTVDERVEEILREKRTAFDSFADKSTAAKMYDNIEVDAMSQNQIIEQEIQRIQRWNACEV